MTILFSDFETWSSVQIRRGTDVYARHARPLIFTWAVDDGPVQFHDFTVEPQLPKELSDLWFDPSVLFVFHNAWFDRNIMVHAMKIEIGLKRFWCTQAQAQAHSLPGGLGPLGAALGLPQDKAKDQDGMRLIRKFCGPKNKFPKVDKGKDEEDWQRFIDYAMQDIVAMRECYNRMPQWNYHGEELNLWRVDQEINMRGFAIDADFANAAVDALKSKKAVLNAQTEKLTEGQVAAATQRDKLLTWLCEQQGVLLPDLRAATIEQVLADDSINSVTREMLLVRLQSAKTSTAKFTRLINSAGPDNRLRGTLNFAGANRTARWAGRIFQPQNLPRPDMDAALIRQSIQVIKEGKPELACLLADNISHACSNALRGLIVASKGKKLVVSDWSNIEGRGLAWLAGEDWKLDAFRALDAGEGEDLYKLIFSKSFNKPVEKVSKFERQQGKGMELSMGYGGGVGAFINVSAAYGLDLEELGREVPKVAPPEIFEKSEGTWEWAVDNDRTLGLTKEVYVACETLKRLYRRLNKKTTEYWYLLENAAKAVIADPDAGVVQVGHCIFDANKYWMRIKLPSGRYLSYALPKLLKDGSISYKAWKLKRWTREKTYGGKLAENITQAVARDILAHSLAQLAEYGMPVVLHVHDEIICEVSDKTVAGFNLQELEHIMTTNPPWAAGLPLAAEGFEGYRYEKH